MLDSNGKLRTVTMGSYGVGVSRAVACIAEGNHDEFGLVWPRAITPADVHIVATGKDDAVFTYAEELTRELEAHGVEVLLDDRRSVSPGVKFKDSELIGVPTIVVVGRGLADGQIEIKDRRSGERRSVPTDSAARRCWPRSVAEPEVTLLLLMVLAGFAAGWVDAVVGGGGLIQLPALVLGFPGASPAQLLATNKISSIFGTATSSITYVRRIRPDLRTALPMAFVAFLGAIGGALIGVRIPKEAFNPIILVMLVLVGAYTVFKPSLGTVTALRYAGVRHTATAMVVRFVIGVYDGRSAREPGRSRVRPRRPRRLCVPRGERQGQDRELRDQSRALVVFVPGGRYVAGRPGDGRRQHGRWLHRRAHRGREGKHVRACGVPARHRRVHCPHRR